MTEDQPTSTDDELERSPAAKRAAPSSLAAELDALPPVAGLEAIKANAQAGYYETAPATALVADLEGLAVETDEHKAILAALIERAKERIAPAPNPAD